VRLEFCHYHQAGKSKSSLHHVVLNPRLVRLCRIFRNYLGNFTIFGYIRLAKIVGSITSRRETKKLQIKFHRFTVHFDTLSPAHVSTQYALQAH
jgi:hypothetical protein